MQYTCSSSSWSNSSFNSCVDLSAAMLPYLGLLWFVPTFGFAPQRGPISTFIVASNPLLPATLVVLSRITLISLFYSFQSSTKSIIAFWANQFWIIFFLKIKEESLFELAKLYFVIWQSTLLCFANSVPLLITSHYFTLLRITLHYSTPQSTSP